MVGEVQNRVVGAHNQASTAPVRTVAELQTGRGTASPYVSIQTTVVGTLAMTQLQKYP